MQHLKPGARYAFLLLMNAIPMAAAILLYRMGGYLDLLGFFPCLVILFVVNFRYTGAFGFLAFQCVYALFTLTGGYLSTLLYTKNISDDGMSYVIGQLMTTCEIFVILVVTVVAFFIKLVIWRRHRIQLKDNES